MIEYKDKCCVDRTDDDGGYSKIYRLYERS